MLFKIDWASLIVGSKFTVFALFYFVFEGNWGAYIWRGLYMEGLIFGMLRYIILLIESRVTRVKIPLGYVADTG